MTEQQIINELKSIKDIVNGTSRRWLSLKEACSYSGMGKETLLSLISSGDIRGGQDTNDKRLPWRIDRHSIDMYYDDLCADNTASKTVKNLSKKLK